MTSRPSVSPMAFGMMSEKNFSPPKVDFSQTSRPRTTCRALADDVAGVPDVATLWARSDSFGFPNTTPAAMAIDEDGDVAEVGTVFASLDAPGSGLTVVYGNDGSLLSSRLASPTLVDVTRDSTGGVIALGALNESTVVTREPELDGP